MTDTPTPLDLSERGRSFWLATVEAFELSDSELPILREACRTLDNLDGLANAISEHGAMVTGSQGQPVVNPALTEARGQRIALHRLLTALNLPDEDGNTLTSARQSAGRSNAARQWAGHRSERALRSAGK